MPSPIDNKAQSLSALDAKTMPKKQLDPDDFIKLFLKQLTTQNPLHPADSSTLLQQMADISSISSAQDTQKVLKNLQQSVVSTMSSTQFLSASQLIGKKIQVPSHISPLVKDEGLSGAVMVPAAAKNIKITIKDSHEKIVKELTLDPTTSGGLVDFSWNGMDESVDPPKPYDPGFYKISAKATINGNDVTLDNNTLGAFKVKSVAANPLTGEVIFNVDGLGGLGLQDIIKIL